ncbi:hypothetical protein U1Q18_040155 [Sarracenia purpurea var. burkii]
MLRERDSSQTQLEKLCPVANELCTVNSSPIECDLLSVVMGGEPKAAISNKGPSAHVISLTEELLETVRQSENSGLDILTNVDASSDLHNAWVTSQRDKEPINMSDLSDKFPVGTKV